jgi:hypothetical protein
MTDKELAEEYRKDLKSKFFLSEPQLDLACQGYKDGFLAGLKAGRPQWHDLRKDPNDLPEDGRIVSDQEGNNVRYVERLNKWFYRHRTCKANVIAWCEIPTFDKE